MQSYNTYYTWLQANLELYYIKLDMYYIHYTTLHYQGRIKLLKSGGGGQTDLWMDYTINQLSKNMQ